MCSSVISNRAIWLSSLILKHFHHSEQKSHGHLSHRPFPQALVSTDLLPVSMDLSILDIQHGWNHTAVGFVVFFHFTELSQGFSMYVSTFHSPFLPESPFNRYGTVCFSTPQWWTSGLLCFLAVTHKAVINLSPSLCEQMFPLLLGLSGEWGCWVRRGLYVQTFKELLPIF